MVIHENKLNRIVQCYLKCYSGILLKRFNCFNTQLDAINGISVWFGMLKFRKCGLALFENRYAQTLP